MNGKGRSTLFGVVGAYLVYLAYGLFRDRADPDTTMAPAVRVLFMTFFTLAGIVLVVYALVLWKRALDEDRHDQEDGPDSMK